MEQLMSAVAVLRAASGASIATGQMVSTTGTYTIVGFVGGIITGTIVKQALKAAITFGSIGVVGLFTANHLGLMNTDWQALRQRAMTLVEVPAVPSYVAEIMAVTPLAGGFVVGMAISIFKS